MPGGLVITVRLARALDSCPKKVTVKDRHLAFPVRLGITGFPPRYPEL